MSGESISLSCSCGAEMKHTGSYVTVASRQRDFLDAHEVCRERLKTVTRTVVTPDDPDAVSVSPHKAQT